LVCAKDDQLEVRSEPQRYNCWQTLASWLVEYLVMRFIAEFDNLGGIALVCQADPMGNVVPPPKY
jgi:hypothetical protein